MIKIAISFCGDHSRQINYLVWLGNEDSSLILKTFIPGETEIEEIESYSGLVLSGGVDINPEIYGRDGQYSNRPSEFDNLRDSYESELYLRSRELKLPVLGICRGMQLLNCLHGGTLVRDNTDRENYIHHSQDYAKAHAVHIVPGTELYKICPLNYSIVNSAHHQSIDKLAPEFTAGCFCGEMIESIEWKNPADREFLMGVQWHPETMNILNLHNTALSLGVRNEFLGQVYLHNQSHEKKKSSTGNKEKNQVSHCG